MANKKREKPKHLGRGLQSLISPIISETTDAEQGTVIIQTGSSA
ncbi:MAG: hypothetical protein ACYTFW_17195 [Planctomycetota bacterium]|jgi:hypothetical protein